MLPIIQFSYSKITPYESLIIQYTAKSSSVQFNQIQVTHSARAKSPSQPDPSHLVYSSARAMPLSILFRVTHYIVKPEPSHPVHSSAIAKSPIIKFS